MDIEKDKQNKEDLLSVENKKIETLNLVSGGNINKTKNRIELHSKKFYTNSLTKKTTFFNYIGLTFEQNTLSSKILIKFFKTSEEKFFLLAEQRNNSIKITKEKINKIINVPCDDFIAKFRVPKNFLRNLKNGELSPNQQKFDNKTFSVLFLDKNNFQSNNRSSEDNFEIFDFKNDSNLNNQYRTRFFYSTNNKDNKNIESNLESDANYVLEVEIFKINNFDSIITLVLQKLKSFLENYIPKEKYIFTIEKEFLIANFNIFKNYIINHQNFDYSNSEHIIGKNDFFKFISLIINLIVPNNVEDYESKINALFLNLNDDLKSHKIAEMEIKFKKKLNHDKTIEITNYQLQILKKSFSSIIKSNIGYLMVLFPDILEGLIYIENLMYENSYKISEYDLINYLYILFVFKKVIYTDLIDKLMKFVGVNLKCSYNKEYLINIFDLILHVRIIFIQLIVPFVKKQVIINYLELIYVFYLENQKFKSNVQNNEKYEFNDKIILMSFYFFEFQSLMKTNQNYKFKKYPFLLFYVLNHINKYKNQITLTDMKSDNNSMILQIFFKLFCRDYFLKNEKSLNFLVLFQLIFSYPKLYIAQKFDLFSIGKTALKQNYSLFYIVLSQSLNNLIQS
ncbi:hypothetical protein GVAV_002745 [Gurleya vavrai]